MKSDIRRLVELLLDSSLNHTEVGRLTGRDRGTVSKLRRRLEAKQITASHLPGMSDQQLAEALKREGRQQLRRSHPDWDEMLRYMVENEFDVIECHQRYLDTHADEGNGLLSYSHFARLLSAHRKRRAPEYRHHYHPGDILEMDFTGDRPIYHHAQAGQVKCTILLTVLPFSQLYTAKVIPSEKRRDVVHGLIQIFGQLGGLPRLWYSITSRPQSIARARRSSELR